MIAHAEMEDLEDLHLNHRNGTLPGNSINSGPGFVTKANVELVKKLAGVER